MTDGHPAAFSRSTITELMAPAYAYFGGRIHGGTPLSLMGPVNFVGNSSSHTREIDAFLAEQRCVIKQSGEPSGTT